MSLGGSKSTYLKQQLRSYALCDGQVEVWHAFNISGQLRRLLCQVCADLLFNSALQGTTPPSTGTLAMTA